jgi:ribosomal protein S18 acetylase RimI-like enzyme
MNTYNLRPVTNEDLDFIYSVMETCFSKYVKEMFGAWDPPVQREIVKIKFLDANSKIIQKNNVDIGLLIVVRGEDEIEISQFAILPQYRYIGLSARIVEDLKAEALNKGVPIKLRVLIRNLYAIKFWRAAGFNVTHKTDTHVYMKWQNKK